MLYIFDWDGTLCNSLDLIAGTIKKSCLQLGLPLRSDAENKSIIGLGLHEAMVVLYPQQSEREIDQLVEAYRDLYVSGDKQQPSDLYEGVIEVLDRLKRDGHRLALATGKSRAGLDRILSALDMQGYFDYSRCSDETRSKPHPLMLNEILHESGVSAEQSIMVGDTDYDLLMAKAASITAVAVSYGAHPLARLHAAQPDRIVDHISELL